MAKFFNIDFRRFFLLMLPTMLRRQLLVSFLMPVISVIDKLYQLFTSNRKSNLYTLKITPQIFALEKALNDRFDAENRGIYIRDSYSDYNPNVFLHPVAENRTVSIFLQAESRPRYLYLRNETPAIGFDFFVNVPESLVFNKNEMIALVNFYKLLGKRFTIITY